MSKLKCEFAIVANHSMTPLTIRDIGHATRMTVTNDIEEVVKHLYSSGILWPDRRFFYFDSDGLLTEVVHHNGQFVEFFFT